MRTDWSALDPRHYEGKTTAELQKRLKEVEAFSTQYPQFKSGWYNEYRQELKRRVAERIGK